MIHASHQIQLFVLVEVGQSNIRLVFAKVLEINSKKFKHDKVFQDLKTIFYQALII